MGYGVKMLFSHVCALLVRGENFEYGYRFGWFGCHVVNVFVVSELRWIVSSNSFGCVCIFSVMLLICKLNMVLYFAMLKSIQVNCLSWVWGCLNWMMCKYGIMCFAVCITNVDWKLYWTTIYNSWLWCCLHRLRDVGVCEE